MASERERFEEWTGPHYLDRRHAPGSDPDEYQDAHRQSQWKAWQARARIAKQWTYCPECGSRDTASHDVLGSGSRVCADCGQDWWIDSDYTDVVRRNLEQWQKAEKPTRIAEQREAELVEALGAYYQEAVSTVTRNISPVCPSIETHNKMLEALAKHKAEGREGA